MCTPQSIVQAVKDAGAFSCHYKVNNSSNSTTDEDDEYDEPDLMSISLYISGGDDVEIAKAIYNSKLLGVALNGDFRVNVDGCNISWYNLNYIDYAFQKKAEKRAGRTLEKEYLLKRLVELEEEDE